MIVPVETPVGALLLVAGLAYLLGSVPFGMIVARLMGLGNLREIGSGNIGATNVLRTGNKAAAFLTLVFDAGKGAAAVLLAARWLGQDAAQVAGLFAFGGHLFPVWLRFRGGKGVATFLGLILALSFWSGFAACMTWLLVAVLFRYSSLAALVAAAATPVWLWRFDRPEAVLLASMLAVLIWWRHRANIARLVSGTESRITGKR